MRVSSAFLDDPAALAAGDPGGMLAAVASSGAQVRAAGEPQFDGSRPRTALIVGMGGSAAAGDVVVAVAGEECQVPLFVHRGETLPGWVGPGALVIAVSCSGRTQETLGAAAEATRRGATLITVGAAGSPLAALGDAAHHPVDAQGRQPRASLWSLAVPMLAVAGAAGLIDVAPALTGAAHALDEMAQRCAPAVPRQRNPAKQLAVHLAGGLPMIWGAPGVGAVVANRFACQLAENAKLPAVAGELSEPHHNQIVAFDGPFGQPAERSGAPRLRLVTIRDAAERPSRERRVQESIVAAQAAGVPAVVLTGEGPDRLARLAGLIQLVDFASVYVALMLGVDPTPVAPIEGLKERLATGGQPTDGEPMKGNA